MPFSWWSLSSKPNENPLKSNSFARYRAIPRSVLLVIGAKLLASTVSGAFLLILNIYLRKLGYDDPRIGSYSALLYLGILMVGLPLGLVLRGRRLKPFLMVGSVGIPVFGFALLYALEHRFSVPLTNLLLVLWSGSFVMVDSFSLPFIIRNIPKNSESEAISLNYSMFAVGTIVAGAVIYLVNSQEFIHLGDWVWEANEYLALLLLVGLSAPGILLVLPIQEKVDSTLAKITARTFRKEMVAYEWRKIGRAVLPTAIIAIGAGLTIPFLNLFFNSVFGVDSDTWGAIGLGTSVLIFLAANLVPFLRRSFGYKIAITLSQTLSVTMLVLLALSQLWSGWSGMLYLAVAFYMLRTPLMNMAGPMTSELVMNYVGKDNQDLVGLLIPSIWSGSWFVSAVAFRWMRAWDLPYYQILLFTAGFYVIGIYLYYRLIEDYSRSLKERME